MRGEKIWMLPIVTLSPFRFSNNNPACCTRRHRSPPPFSQTKSANKLIVSLILNVIWSLNNVFQVRIRDASLSRWQGARSEANQKVRWSQSGCCSVLQYHWTWTTCINILWSNIIVVIFCHPIILVKVFLWFEGRQSELANFREVYGVQEDIFSFKHLLTKWEGGEHSVRIAKKCYKGWALKVDYLPLDIVADVFNLVTMLRFRPLVINLLHSSWGGKTSESSWKPFGIGSSAVRVRTPRRRLRSKTRRARWRWKRRRSWPPTRWYVLKKTCSSFAVCLPALIISLLKGGDDLGALLPLRRAWQGRRGRRATRRRMSLPRRGRSKRKRIKQFLMLVCPSWYRISFVISYLSLSFVMFVNWYINFLAWYLEI